MNNIGNRLLALMHEKDISYGDLSEKTNIPKSAIHRYVTGATEKIPIERIKNIAAALGVSAEYILGWNDESSKLKNPTVTSDTVVLPVIGNIAAGYDEIAIEDWSGETVEVPCSYLKGRDKKEFIVLKVHGDSMFPEYHNGDKVVILKQATLPRSGTIGAVLYDGESATLKRVEYFNDKIKLIPINPTYPPKTITGPDCESVRIIGIPKVLIREIEE
ncbi:MAG: helix-turn-helix domain-containing protein [Clostridia bacterium]|nr:helix-turn-helix domain-containing protein [Clostridia bacterium]